MAAPNSNGVLRTKLSDMKIGDYIKWQYNGGSDTTIGTLKADDGTENELPSTPLATGITGYFYFIKWKQGLLVADRAIHANISAQMLNKAGYFKGSQYFCPTLDQFQAFCADDFNGNFKFSNANFPIATEALDPNFYIGERADLKGRPITQDLKIVREMGYAHAAYAPFDTTDHLGFTQALKNTDVDNNYTVYLPTYFLPCMEYVDNSKSTNIYY